MECIKIQNVSKDYYLGKTVINALKHVSFEINKGDFISVVGPSGCGKTTLLNLISCLDKPTDGKIFYDNKDISLLKDNEESEMRLKNIGFIFQSFNLITVLTAAENIEFPLIIDGVKKAERKKIVDQLVSLVGLSEYSIHKPDELSGGQRQRVAIARALVNNPSLVIADEPTANLDSTTGKQILDVMRELNEKQKVTFIFSTHNEEVMGYAKRIIHLKDGIIQSQN
ncbi:MAG: ABC transporter ATP-binding protein [Spirochaetales bacterium]|nr:ABC transporter ATP-binding protein [Spirochaetales bacterium]